MQKGVNHGLISPKKLHLLENTEKQHIDIIILNEMDIGMARSNNLHTTRLLAESMNMNFVFGIEFVEFTKGNEKEQQENIGKSDIDTYSIHGNAILCKCIFNKTNYKLLRSNIKNVYFSQKKSAINANGFEKRLGGRMGIFIQAKFIKHFSYNYNAISLIIDSVHKMGKEQNEHVTDYIEQNKKNNTTNIDYIIVGGDQYASFCDDIKLEPLFDKTTNTWPANCHKYGTVRGDILCVNIVSNIKQTLLPCFNGKQISDHAIIRSSISLWQDEIPCKKGWKYIC
eukprot:407518_1